MYECILRLDFRRQLIDQCSGRSEGGVAEPLAAEVLGETVYNGVFLWRRMT